MIRAIACTGCRLGEIVTLKWADIDAENSCIRLGDSKEGASTRPIGLSVMDFFDRLRADKQGVYVFPGTQSGEPLIGFPKILDCNSEEHGAVEHYTACSSAQLRDIANDLGSTEVTIAALLGHSRGTITSRYIHTVDTALIMAADTVAGYVQGLLDGVEFKHISFLDRVRGRLHLGQLFDEPKKNRRTEEKQSVDYLCSLSSYGRPESRDTIQVNNGLLC